MNFIIEKNKETTKLPMVMRAAIKLFVKKGIDGTTIKDIAREAGVAEGALYRHFKSKDELAWSLFSTHLDAFTKELEAKVFAEEGAEKRIRAFVSESFSAFESDPELYTYLILREHSELEKFAEAYIHPGHVVLRIVKEGQKSGEIRSGDPYVLGSLFVGGVIRVAVVKMYGAITENLQNSVALVSEMIWTMLRRAN